MSTVDSIVLVEIHKYYKKQKTIATRKECLLLYMLDLGDGCTGLDPLFKRS